MKRIHHRGTETQRSIADVGHLSSDHRSVSRCLSAGLFSEVVQ